jgi:hypothetical protein
MALKNYITSVAGIPFAGIIQIRFAGIISAVTCNSTPMRFLMRQRKVLFIKMQSLPLLDNLLAN